MDPVNLNWNRLVGKKILFFDSDEEPCVCTCEITGCDPDIGICLNVLGDPDPSFISLGCLAPNLPDYWKDKKEEVDRDLTRMYNMLISGYFSTDEYFKDRDFYSTFTMMACPYSL